MQPRIIIGLMFCGAVLATAFSMRPSDAAPQPVLLSGSGQNAVTAPGGRSGMIYSVAFTPDAKTLAAGDDRSQISLWDTATHQRKAILAGHKGFVRALAWSHDGKELLSAGNLYNKNGSIGDAELKIWNVAGGKPRFELNQQDFYLTQAAWSPDGKTIALGGTRFNLNVPQVELRDAATGKLLRTLTLRNDNKSVNRLQFSPDSKTLLTLLHWVCEGALWDVQSGELVRDVKPAPHLKIPFAADVFAFSPDSKMLARGQFDGGLILENARSGTLLRTFTKQPPFNIQEVRFAPDGKMLWSMTSFVHFKWDVTTGEMLSKTQLDSGGSPQLSGDGSLLAGYTNQNLYLTHLTP